MTFTTSITLLLAMLVLAIVPGPGILAVLARSASGGFRHGFSTSAGIVAGDFVFITLALLGLAALADLMGGLFELVKYLGAAYLLWLGFSIALSKPANSSTDTVEQLPAPSHLASFMAGLVTTLGNPKAILFYVSFFPAFLDLSRVSMTDAAIIYAVATLAVGGVMLGYAFIASRMRGACRLSGKSSYLRYGSGGVLVCSGVYVATRG